MDHSTNQVKPPAATNAVKPVAGVLPDDPMSEAGRKILLAQFEVMLKHEPGARSGEDTDAIHDMRVATRRMRSAIRLFDDFYKKNSPLTVFNKSLRRTAASLGDVRDLDVFGDKTHDYSQTLSDEAKTALAPFHEALKHDEKQARQALHDWLDSERYAHFIEAFRSFLTTPGVGAAPHSEGGQPYQVRHVAPRLIYERYTAMRAFETALPDASLDLLHRLRIEGKQMRYALEFFIEVLGPESKAAIEAVKQIQDHLGNLQDARVACERLQAYLKRADERENLAPVVKYLEMREAEKHKLIEGVPAAWTAFTDPKVRRAIALSVAAL